MVPLMNWLAHKLPVAAAVTTRLGWFFEKIPGYR